MSARQTAVQLNKMKHLYHRKIYIVYLFGWNFTEQNKIFFSEKPTQLFDFFIILIKGIIDFF